jgi:hypothetical protein
MPFEAITLYPRQKCAKNRGKEKISETAADLQRVASTKTRFRRIERRDCDLGVQRGWSPKALPARATDPCG